MTKFWCAAVAALLVCAGVAVVALADSYPSGPYEGYNLPDGNLDASGLCWDPRNECLWAVTNDLRMLWKLTYSDTHTDPWPGSPTMYDDGSWRGNATTPYYYTLESNGSADFEGVGIASLNPDDDVILVLDEGNNTSATPRLLAYSGTTLIRKWDLYTDTEMPHEYNGTAGPEGIAFVPLEYLVGRLTLPDGTPYAGGMFKNGEGRDGLLFIGHQTDWNRVSGHPEDNFIWVFELDWTTHVDNPKVDFAPIHCYGSYGTQAGDDGVQGLEFDPSTRQLYAHTNSEDTWVTDFTTTSVTGGLALVKNVEYDSTPPNNALEGIALTYLWDAGEYGASSSSYRNFFFVDDGGNYDFYWYNNWPLTDEPSWGDVIYVNGDHSGTEDGESWATPYNTLEEGLSAASSGDFVFVAEGTYEPTGSAFTIADGDAVSIIGGFSGDGVYDPAQYPTTLSADISGNDEDANPWGEGSSQDADNLDYILENFSQSDAEDDMLLRSLVFRGAHESAVAIGMDEGKKLSIQDCVFRYNGDTTAYSDSAVIEIQGGPDFELLDSQIVDNNLAAIIMSDATDTSPDIDIHSALVTRNDAYTYLFSFWKSGGDLPNAGDISFTDVCIYDNEAHDDDDVGAIEVWGGYSNLDLYHVSIYDQEVQAEYPNAAAIRLGDDVEVNISNSTIWWDTNPYSLSDGYYGLIMSGYGDDWPSGSVLADNTIKWWGTGDIYDLESGGSWASYKDDYWAHPFADDGDCSGCDTDPSDPGLLADCILPTGSSLVDAGSNGFVYGDYDSLRNTRLVNSIVDIGAVEYQHDCNKNGVLDATDISSGDSNDANSDGLPDECVDTSDLELDGSWYSLKTHTTNGELGMEFPLTQQTRTPVETRTGSVTTLQFEFSKPIDPDTFDTSSVEICGHNSSPGNPLAVGLGDGDNGVNTVATLIFAEGQIPNGEDQDDEADHYVAVVSTGVTDLLGNALSGDRDVTFAASHGNVKAYVGTIGNWRSVNPLDRTDLILNMTSSPSDAVALVYDLDLDGDVDNDDKDELEGSYTVPGEQMDEDVPSCS